MKKLILISLLLISCKNKTSIVSKPDTLHFEKSEKNIVLAGHMVKKSDSVTTVIIDKTVDKINALLAENASLKGHGKVIIRDTIYVAVKGQETTKKKTVVVDEEKIFLANINGKAVLINKDSVKNVLPFYHTKYKYTKKDSSEVGLTHH